jgi:MoCo/4Fe-4S cofactor protein with predicted Tat translocation signal
MSEKPRFDIAAIREKLSGDGGRKYWRSLDQLADTPEFEEFLHREFPREASVWDESFNRRNFLKLMGASLALGGLSACVKQPDEKIIPYVKQPEILVPGTPLYFATAIPMGGYAHGVLVKSHMGRPTHIEGNPDHPASLGASDIIVQASILSLYDPDRSQVILNNGRISTSEKFQQAVQIALEIQRSLKGAGLRILTETVTSPTLGSQLNSLLSAFPRAKWYQYEPANHDNVREGARLVFGRHINTVYSFKEAHIVVSLDADFLGEGPGHVRYARDFSSRRRVSGAHADMNRLYAFESTPTITGGIADHRFRMRASEVETVARALAAALGVPGVSAPSSVPVDEGSIKAVARDVQRHKANSIVIVGMHQPPVVHALAHFMNLILGNIGKTVLYTDPVEVSPTNHAQDLRSLVQEMDAGQVDMLVVLGGNPVYNTPADLDFGGQLPKVKISVHLGVYEDETAVKSTWHTPETHSLEAWSDARAYDGTTSIIQPLIAPLYTNARSSHELLELILGRMDRKGYDVVTQFWKAGRRGEDFARFWKTSLNDGLVSGSASPLKSVAPSVPPGGWKFSPPRSGMEIMFRPDPSVGDGRHANNGWLQELPKNLTRVTWDNAAYVSPATAQRLVLSNEDVVELKWKGRTVEAPVWIWPGHPDDSVTLHLGYGRTRAGRVGSRIGVDAYQMRTSDTSWFDTGLDIRKTGRRYRIACVQDHNSMEGRPIVRSADVAEFENDPAFAKEMAHNPAQKESFYPPYEYDGYAWGMTIDLNACTGCNACMVACQSENNVPIVGKDQVMNGREMHWIRIDRYYEGIVDDPATLLQPVACQHCENAPCEVVCPVAATTHDHEGLNVMTYNRCVGTRYCANNCPYKVRRFNFLQYSDTTTESYKLMRNPDVTVRNRGVMEKCTYCIQRISAARIEAKKEDRDIRDGEVTTACQAACPAQAITFGNINDKSSKVAKLKADPRDYGLLTELNTKPRTSYLAKLRNPNPEIATGRDDVSQRNHQ